MMILALAKIEQARRPRERSKVSLRGIQCASWTVERGRSVGFCSTEVYLLCRLGLELHHPTRNVRRRGGTL